MQMQEGQISVGPIWKMLILVWLNYRIVVFLALVSVIAFGLTAVLPLGAAPEPALVPPPGRHSTHYYGVLSSHARLREKVIASAGPSGALGLRLLEAAQKMDIAPLSQETSSDADERIEAETFPCSFPYTWAMLLSRIYDVL